MQLHEVLESLGAFISETQFIFFGNFVTKNTDGFASDGDGYKLSFTRTDLPDSVRAEVVMVVQPDVFDEGFNVSIVSAGYERGTPSNAFSRTYWANFIRYTDCADWPARFHIDIRHALYNALRELPALAAKLPERGKIIRVAIEKFRKKDFNARAIDDLGL